MTTLIASPAPAAFAIATRVQAAKAVEQLQTPDGRRANGASRTTYGAHYSCGDYLKYEEEE